MREADPQSTRRRGEATRELVSADRLLVLAGVLFALTGLAYLVVPAAMLGVAGIASTPTSDFLLRTEGVALLAAAGLAWAARGAGTAARRLALWSIAAYCFVGGLIDLAAFAEGIAGPLSVPSAVARGALGIACVVIERRAR